jgi:uncharacterized membrane protein YfcA
VRTATHFFNLTNKTEWDEDPRRIKKLIITKNDTFVLGASPHATITGGLGRTMIFPISGIEVNPFVAFGVACIISFFTSMAGVSGAFLLLPFQVSFLGYSAPSVSATNQVFNIVAIPSGVYRYIREGRMLWPLTWAVIIGTLPGVFIGAWVRIVYLPDPKNFKLFVGAVLLYIGLRLLLDLLHRQAPAGAPRPSPKGSAGLAVKVRHATWRQVAFEYDGATHRFSPPVVYIIFFWSALLAALTALAVGRSWRLSLW